MVNSKSKLVLIPVLWLALTSCSTSTVSPTVNGAPDEVDHPSQGPTEQSGSKGTAAPDSAGPPALESRHLLQTVENGIPTTSRCYTLTTERVIFKVYDVTSDNRSDWDALANNTASTCEGTRKWDNKWYWYSIRYDRVNKKMLLWLNIDKNEYGYLVIKREPTMWLAYSNTGGPWTLKQDEVFSRSWTSNDKKIVIRAKNPADTGDWDSTDVWVSFGQ